MLRLKIPYFLLSGDRRMFLHARKGNVRHDVDGLIHTKIAKYISFYSIFVCHIHKLIIKTCLLRPK